MGWHPQIRRHTRKGRKPWYTIQFEKTDHYLGTDRAEAHIKAAAILGKDPSVDRPQMVAGLIMAYNNVCGSSKWKLARWGEFCRGMFLMDLDTKALQAYADHLIRAKLAPWTIKHYVQYARDCWMWGVDRGWIKVKPDRVKTPAPMLRPRDLPIKRIRVAIKKMNNHVRPLVEFILHTGCRPIEARTLKWVDVDIVHRVCVLTEHKTSRTGNPRVIPLTDAAIKVLSARDRRRKFVFTNRTGKPYTRAGLRSVVSRAGISSVYSLRHTFAQWFLDRGGDKSELQAWLGHSDSRMTDVYARIKSKRLVDRAQKLTSPLAS